jgi:hypothetical protein
MNKYLASIIIAFSAVTGYSCSDSSDPVTPSNTESVVILPLALGNTWLYQHTMTTPEGEELFSDSTRVSVIRVDTVSAEQWYLMSNTFFYITRPSGLWMCTGKTEAPYMAYKSPAVNGDSYDLYDNFGKVTHYRVLAVDEELEVRAGSFTCWKLHAECPSCMIEDTVYIAPGIGDVLTVAHLANGNTLRIEMLSYTIEDD